MINEKYDILCALDVCVDLIMTGDVVPRFGQAEQLVCDYMVEMGGSAAIFAAQCARLGQKVLGLGTCGSDAFGGLFIEKLRGTGVDTSQIIIDPRQKTGLGLALLSGDDRAILTYTGTIDGLSPNVFTDSLLYSARHLHIASPYLMPKLAPHWPAIAGRAKAAGMSISLDTNWDPAEKWDGLWDLLPYIDIFLPNERELAAVGGLAPVKDIVPIIALKQGRHGATLYTKGNTYHAPAFDFLCVDAIGAGDSFDGGFISAYLSGAPLDVCLQRGCACGSLNIRARGGIAGQGTLSQIDLLLKNGAL